MCGIFGYSGNGHVDILRLRYLATENQSRGDHSTGVYGNYLYKVAKPARDVVATDEFYDAVYGAFNVIGHTRHATMGARIDKNSHPFEVFRSEKHTDAAVVGTHNGMLFDTAIKTLCEKYKLKEPDVDSELIYQILVHNEFDYDVLSEIEGAMALAFIRPEHPDYLYLYHRLSRPLNIGYTDDGMYYSSESEPLALIGCHSIDSLDTDQLFTFKKGSLVEVSDIKKSRIISIQKDQSLTTWLNQTATTIEKTALGISGAVVKQEAKNVNQQNPQLFPHLGTQEKNGGAGRGISLLGPIKTGVSSSLLPDFNSLNYSFESLDKVDKGRFYESGNTQCCYLLFQLFEKAQTESLLPAWMVRVKGHCAITAISTHNGLGVLEIPASLCGEAILLEIVNPLRAEVIYSIKVDRPIAGRVLEVALYIPFRKEEKTIEESGNEEAFIDSYTVAESGESEKTHSFERFSDWLAFAINLPEDLESIRRESKGLQKRTSERVDDIPFEASTCEYNPNGVERSYHETIITDDTDILNMDYYDAAQAFDEIQQHQKKIKEALSSLEDIDSDPQAFTKAQYALVSISPFLDYLRTYLKDKMEQQTQHGS